jgi:ABC-type Zn uptake system ZnuABC Zn-binding protein ZnuA
MRLWAGIPFLLWALSGAAAPLKIVATTAEMRSLAEAVGGDRITAVALIPPGVDGEAFQPKPQDVALLREASLVVRVGADYDLWLDGLLRQSGNAEIQRGARGYVDASTDVALLDVRAGGLGDGHAHGRGNPHYWLDPMNAQAITGTLLEALARVDPGNARHYEANRLAFLAKLDGRLAEWQKLLAKPPTLIAYHDSWPYLARRFRLRFVGVVETRPGIAPSPAHLAQLARTASSEHIAAVVREPHEPLRDAEFVASKAGARVAVLTTGVGAVPQARDYLSLIDYNVRTLAALR